MNGIDPAIISRANKIGRLSARGEDLVVICATLSTDEMNELKEAVSLLADKINAICFAVLKNSWSRKGWRGDSLKRISLNHFPMEVQRLYLKLHIQSSLKSLKTRHDHRGFTATAML